MSEKRGLDAIEELADAADGVRYATNVLTNIGSCGTREYQDKYDASSTYGSGLAAWLRCAVRDAREQASKPDVSGYVSLPKGADGETLRPGQTVYGADGRAWKIEYVRWGVAPRAIRYPIAAVGPNGERRKLRAKWLTHDLPDSWERLAEDMLEVARHCYPNDCSGNRASLAATCSLVRRAKRLSEAGVQETHTCGEEEKC